MARAFHLLFGVVAYLGFFATFLYLIAFVGNLPWVPRTVDRGHEVVGLAHAVAADLALIAIRHEERDLVGLFGTQYQDCRRRAGMLVPRFGRGR